TRDSPRQHREESVVPHDVAEQSEGSKVLLSKLSQAAWKPVSEGVYFAGLHASGKNAGTGFFKWDEGAYSGTHHHPGGEEVYVISGKLRVGDLTLEEGDFLYTPPGETHDVTALTEAVALIALPGGIQFVDA